ncbi:hypothetical protein AV530_019766 [Patagioenas fasciata monilis]|uniref:Uncharacterized protein n=1 Tax=Patagioenas fasciata monilis TaxID=372326 RepID=A0A1V4JZ72_PATFA|nr:hypothetical protein AV530_019766 [Patagioenas fasciata monilis]
MPESALLQPTVLLAIIARNAAHTLPHFLGCIERLRYPKSRIALWMHKANCGFSVNMVYHTNMAVELQAGVWQWLNANLICVVGP